MTLYAYYCHPNVTAKFKLNVSFIFVQAKDTVAKIEAEYEIKLNSLKNSFKDNK